ncbi:hypothetical protein EGJ61_16015 [Klebsiella quasipneumoniae]|nr:hypothetical protein EGJ61_16015 [Klebsiella quasipneumoniae]
MIYPNKALSGHLWKWLCNALAIRIRTGYRAAAHIQASCIFVRAIALYGGAILRFSFAHFVALSVVPNLLLLARRWILLGGKAWR